MKRIVTLLIIGFIGITAYGQGNWKQSVVIGHTNPCAYQIEFKTVDLNTMTFTWQGIQSIAISAGASNILTPPPPATGEYITEFRVRPVGGVWTYVIIDPNDTCPSNVSLNSTCSGTTTHMVGFCQTDPTNLEIALYDN